MKLTKRNIREILEKMKDIRNVTGKTCDISPALKYHKSIYGLVLRLRQLISLFGIMSEDSWF